MLTFQTLIALFCPCVWCCILDLALYHCRVGSRLFLAVWITPLLAICNICSLLHCMLCLLWDQQSCLHCKCWHSSLHLSVCVKCGTEASFNSQSHQELIELFVSECSRHDIRNGTTHEHSQRKLMYTMTEGSVISDVRDCHQDILCWKGSSLAMN